jgi:rfaE bifunctional protein nucleotidyltransferase chain/domain
MRNGKTHTIQELAQISAHLRADGKTIAHCHGAFDLLHPGHIRHLQAAKSMADVLVVTLTEDQFIRKGPGRPVFNERLRADTVAAIEAVDHVATSPWPTAVETIELLRPHLYVKGQDYKDQAKDVTGAITEEQRAVERCGGRLVFTNELQFRSTKLLNEFFGVFTEEQRRYLHCLRERYTAEDVLARLDTLRTASVLVVGEAIIDEYHYCTPDAMSNKSPTLSARFESAEVFVGGVVPVGNHLAGLAHDVTILAGIGIGDTDSIDVTSTLIDGVKACVIARPDAPTVRKRRFVHRVLNQKLFEVTFLEDRPIPPEAEQAFLATIDAHASQADVVIVCDFGHGFFTQPVVERLREKSNFLAVNAQINSSNRGFNNIRKYKGADYISVDEYEIRLPFGNRYGPLTDVVNALSEETGCTRINVTLGANGTLYCDGTHCYHAPVLTNTIVDTMGAGDALLAATALMVYSGAPPELVPFVGNCMGGLMTQIVGHRKPINAADLYKFINTLLT